MGLVAFGKLIRDGGLIAPMEVFHEKRSARMKLLTWLKERESEMFREIDDGVQAKAAKVLKRFPRLVVLKKQDTSAESFVIALAQTRGIRSSRRRS